jgi:surface carbohydrate biosynthesis protein
MSFPSLKNRQEAKSRAVFIPYETKVREFDGKLLLIAHLLNAGFTKVYFGSRSAMKQEALLRYDGIYIMKSMTKTEEAFYAQLRDRGFILVLLHAEGGIHYKNNMEGILSIYDPSLIEYLDFNFVFGESIKQDIGRYCGEEYTDNTVISGEPRFDLLKSKLQPYYNKKVAKLIGKYKNGIILVNTSFGVAHPVVGKDKLLEYLSSEPTYTDETKRLLFKKMLALEDVTKAFVHAIKEIATAFESKQIIIRPHPSESETQYRTELGHIRNVIISKEGSVHEWILAADCIIHYDCTTGMEAVLAGKPVLSFLPKYDEDIIAWLPVELSKKCYTNSELIRQLNNIYENNYTHKIKEKVYTEWQQAIHNVGNDASEIISSTLKPFLKIDKISLVEDGWIKGYHVKIYNYIKSHFNWLRKTRGTIGDLKFGELSVKEVKDKIHRIASILEFKHGARVSKRAINLVLISKR